MRLPRWDGEIKTGRYGSEGEVHHLHLALFTAFCHSFMTAPKLRRFLFRGTYARAGLLPF